MYLLSDLSFLARQESGLSPHSSDVFDPTENVQSLLQDEYTSVKVPLEIDDRSTSTLSNYDDIYTPTILSLGEISSTSSRR